MCVGRALWILVEHGDGWMDSVVGSRDYYMLCKCVVHGMDGMDGMYGVIYVIHVIMHGWDAVEIVAELCVRLRGSYVTQYVHSQSQSTSVMSDTNGAPVWRTTHTVSAIRKNVSRPVLLMTIIRPRSRNIDTTLEGCRQSDTGLLTAHDVCHHLICLHYQRQQYMCVG